MDLHVICFKVAIVECDVLFRWFCGGLSCQVKPEIGALCTEANVC